MKSFANIDIENQGNYLKLLNAISKLSKLFSESNVPLINYRAVENIFCKSFNAQNLSRSDTAFDAKYNSTGIGIKTFTLNNSSNTKVEKIAEFNSLSKTLSKFRGVELAVKLSEFRNERINFAKRLYNIENSIYHIVARKENELLIYETDYDNIDIGNISEIKQQNASFHFKDNKNQYSYNYSKSTLFRKFYIPQNVFKLPVEILDDPYSLLLDNFTNNTIITDKYLLSKELEYVILPLYSIKDEQKYVYPKSALNQWNAGGRSRDIGEVYLKFPSKIHKLFPNFFPGRDKIFNLEIPTGEIFSAKVCQDRSKAIMTNPNNALSDWLLRSVLRINEGELLTIQKLNELGFDCIILSKIDNENFKIDIAKENSYEDFISKRDNQMIKLTQN